MECFHCGLNAVSWDSDTTPDRVFEDGDEWGVVHILHCNACGATIYYHLPSEDFKE